MSIFDQSFYETNTTGCLGCCTESSHPFLASGYANSGAHGNNQLQLTGEDQQEKEEIDTMLSEAFNTLSFEERQVQQEELHGVAGEIAEDARLVENSLQELESFLLNTKGGSFYETAEQMNPAYVHAPSFQIPFLRAERYNAKAAADRMLKFFDEKQKLFGTDKLTKDITIDDLDPDDIAALEAGPIQWAATDRSNRPILLQLPGLRKFKELKNELRARYFVMMECVKSPEAQLRGFVVITYAVGDFKDCHQGHGYLENNRLSEALPMYVGAFHFVVDDFMQVIIGKAALALLPADLRVRFRVHLGTHVECQYRLSTYGIPTALLPLSPETSAVDLEPHLRWCQNYTSKDAHGDGTKDQLMTMPSSSNCGSIITEPNPNDVLSAGSTKSDNIGNDRLRVLVKDYVEAYRSGSYDDKRRIVDGIIGEVHEAGGRFLQKERGSLVWNELSMSKVREKIGQRFRNHNRRRETASKQAREGVLIADMPLPIDVIFGTRRTQRNKGTALLHHLIKDRSEEYVAANRSAKVVVVDTLIQRIQSEGGRFLQPSTSDQGGYVELSTDSIRDRISTYFRNYRRSSRTTAMTSGQ